ncbi:MAG: hypothetical protein AAGA56_24980 [Myxococcota bacterium]
MSSSTVETPPDALVAQAMAEENLPLTYRATVLRFCAREDPFWRRCCGSGCSPCMGQLGRVVDRIRELAGESA